MTLAWRVSNYDTPCPPSPSRRPSRWAPAGGMVANYWSLHPHGPWAELYRAQALTAARDVVGQVASRLWVADLSHLDLAPIEDLLDQVGLTPRDLVDDDWSRCQAAGVQLAAAGHTALTVPSAALPHTRNLVLFGQRLAIPFGDAAEAVDVPCAVVADRTHGAGSVMPSVRHYGTPLRNVPYRPRVPDPLPA